MKVTLKGDQGNNYIAQNVVLRYGKSAKVPGTNKYNLNALPQGIRWATRYYGLKADGTFVKYLFCYSKDTIYMGNDITGELTAVKTGLQENVYPESVVQQVADNSRMYFFNGYDTPIYYEGNDAGIWYNSAITYKFVQGVIKDSRLFAFERDSSTLLFSRALYPDDFSATYGGSIIIGNQRDSFIRRIELLGNSLYIFKNDSIWVLTGTTKASYSVECVIPNMGLLTRRALCPVVSALVFVSQQDGEIYEFNGTAATKRLSSNIRKKTGYYDGGFWQLVDPNKTDDMCCVHDTVNNLFRLSYNGVQAAETYVNNEVIFPTDDVYENGQPKWSETYGARILCYSIWNRQGDHVLVTGRSDTGQIMYHNRGKNWDIEKMVVQHRFDDIMPEEGRNCDFDSIYVKAKPIDSTLTLRTYLNTRESDYNENAQNTGGERRTIGIVTMPTQYFANNWKPTLTGYNHGENFGVEIYDETEQGDMEVSSIIVNVVPRERIMNQLVGG